MRWLAVLAVLVPGLAVAAPSLTVLVAPRPEDAEKAAATLLGKDARTVAWRPPAESDLGGVWVLGLSGGRPCPRASLAGTYVDEALLRAQGRLDALEMKEAGAELASVRQTVACLSAPVEPKSLWRMHFLEAVAAFYTSGLPSARSSLRRALAVLPAEPFDPSYPPELRDLYLEVQRDVLTSRPSPLAAGDAGPDEPGAVWIDGQFANGPALSVVPGEHVLQVRDESGALRGSALVVPTLSAVIVARAGQVGTALAKLDAESRQLLADATTRSASAPGAALWFWDGSRLWDGYTGQLSARDRLDPGTRDVVSSLPDPLVQLAAAGGYQWLSGAHWGWGGLDLDLRIRGPLRFAAMLRLAGASLPQPIIVDGTERTSTLLTPFGVGVALRFVRPFVFHVPILAQFAINRDGQPDQPFLVGAQVGLGVDIPLGHPRIFLRPLGELGLLGPNFVVRGGVGFGVSLGGA